MQKKKDNITYNKSQNAISIFGKIPIEYNGDIGYVDTVLNNLKKKYNEFANLLDNYFIKYKYNYFINGDYNYSKIPKDVRSNSFLENYNTFLKKKLGKKKFILDKIYFFY